MRLDDFLERLFKRSLHTIKLDLEPMRGLMEILGNPHQKLVCLHIAGTNGKGSVSAMLESVLRTQGYRTGLYTSPHLVRFNERIQVNGRAIADEDLMRLIREVDGAAGTLVNRGQRDVTFFEFTTALAFLHFAQAGIDIAVIETGMGGRLDATNVIVPALSIITSIGFDHMAYLGDTLEKIAGEKAGIIKPGRPVIVGNLPETAELVMLAKARALNAPVRLVRELNNTHVRSVSLSGQKMSTSSNNCDYGTINLGLSGEHQAANASVAIAACECLDHELGIPVSIDAIKKGLAKVHWPARLELLESDPPVVLDGAHNPEAAHALARWLKKVAAKKPVGLVAGFLQDKDPAGFAKAMADQVKYVWLVPVQSDRAMPVPEARRLLDFMPHVHGADSLEAGISAARKWARAEGGLVLIAGSLYVAGEALQLKQKGFFSKGVLAHE